MTDIELSGYVHKFHSMVFRLAYSYLKNREDAEDISQEVFIKLYSNKKPFSDEGHIKGWLIRVTVNLCKDCLRSQRYTSHTELTADIPASEQENNDVIDLINRLKPDYGGVIYLYYYEGYSAKEIASILKISHTAVTSRLNRGRKQLKEMLLKEGYYETSDT